jgi:hypothetical protein
MKRWLRRYIRDLIDGGRILATRDFWTFFAAYWTTRTVAVLNRRVGSALAPGSEKVRARGCICPAPMEQLFGLPVWELDEECPVHGEEARQL